MTTLTQTFPELDESFTLVVNTPSTTLRDEVAPALDIRFECSNGEITITTTSTNLRDATEDELALVLDFITSNTKMKLMAGLAADITMHPTMVQASNLLHTVLLNDQ
ncbi:hypothetical protein [Aquabacterium sp.]|uniref:hypothetical protein n=1 Tax=Aquabacterium sp. TaxID=1872578 RepID=UPI003D6D9211